LQDRLSRATAFRVWSAMSVVPVLIRWRIVAVIDARMKRSTVCVGFCKTSVEVFLLVSAGRCWNEVDVLVGVCE
jgi:hypothetical protein